VVGRYVYDPFGQVTVLNAEWNVLAGSAFAWVYLHQGGRFVTTSGLYHFRFRDYSPTLGRWTSLDPLSYAAGM
jgi:RHS repeat-associated protein